MHIYCRLKSGKRMIVYSDNVDEKTMHLFELEELDELGNYDAEFLTTEEYCYSEIDQVSEDLDFFKASKGV